MSAVATVEVQRAVTGARPVRLVRQKTREGRRLPRVRGDTLPEETRYRDDGCDIHPNCLTCPLPRCRYEEPGGLRGLINDYRDRQIVALREQGMEVPELSEQFDVSRRTVFRIIGNASHRRRSQRRMPVPIFRNNQDTKEAQCA